MFSAYSVEVLMFRSQDTFNAKFIITTLSVSARIASLDLPSALIKIQNTLGHP